MIRGTLQEEEVSTDVVAACHPHGPPPSPHTLFPSTLRAKPPKPTARRPPPLGPWLSPHLPSGLPEAYSCLALPPPPAPWAGGLATASASTHSLPNLSTLRSRASLILASRSQLGRRTQGSGEQSCPWGTGTNTLSSMPLLGIPGR